MISTSLLTFAALALAHGPPQHGWPHPQPPQGRNSSWDLKDFKTLIAFGDSYTDDNRLNYFIENNGSAPPVGWVNPANYHAADGGRPWVQYVAQYAGVELHNYAVAGAVCSNDITPRTLVYIHQDFPSVREYEVPAWIADKNYTEPDGTKFIEGTPDETVYAIWIGTNDLGSYAFITDSQVKGTDITTYMDCVYEQVKKIYDNGGRYFVLMNVVPLDLAPLYATPENGGVKSNPSYWPTKPNNLTEISGRMLEQVVTVNSIYEYRTPFATRISNTLPGARIANYDVHGLFEDIYHHPEQYLNGTAPANVTGVVSRGDFLSDSPDSFLWFDDLHPSEQTERIVAREFVNVVKGEGRWGTYW